MQFAQVVGTVPYGTSENGFTSPCWACGAPSAFMLAQGPTFCCQACEVAYQAMCAPVEPTPCVVCRKSNVVSGTEYCSKRCSWFASQRCPHCGRSRDPNYTYCSVHCAAQALQANWCASCGVRQIAPGTSSCGWHPCCTMLQPQRTARGSGLRIDNPATTGARKELPSRHIWMPPEDKLRTSTVAPLLLHCRQVLGVVKFVPDNAQKKRYLCYRSNVEQAMATLRVTKYGHGGEGNEHRRYYPMPAPCDALIQGVMRQLRGEPLSTAQCCCYDPACFTCALLTQTPSSLRFSTSTASAALRYSSATPLRATANVGQHGRYGAAAGRDSQPAEQRSIASILVARTVVGVPQFVQDFTAAPEEPTVFAETDPQLSAELMSSVESYNVSPEDESLSTPIVPTATATNSTVLVKDDGTDEMMVDRDDAVDALFLVLVEL